LKRGCFGQSEGGSDWGKTTNKIGLDAVDLSEFVTYLNRRQIEEKAFAERILDS